MKKVVHCCSLLLLVLAAVTVTITSGEVNPGLRLRLSQNGLNYAGNVAIDKLSAKVRGARLPDQSGKKRLKVGKVSYSITGMAVTRFNRPTSRIVINPGKGLTWSTAGTDATISGNWRYKYKLGFIRIRDHGRFSVSVSGLDFSVSVTLGVDRGGRPTLTSTGCTSRVGRVRVKFHGGRSWLYNLFRKFIERPLKRQLQSKICKLAREEIDKKGRGELSTLNVLAPLGKQMVLDYRLTKAPVFGSGYLESCHKGEVFWKADPRRRPPFLPAPLPMSIAMPSKMVYIWASDHVINSLSYAAFRHGLLQHNLRKSISGTRYLADIVSELATGPSGRTFDSILINLKATVAPTVDVSPSGINLKLTGEVKISGVHGRSRPVYLLTVRVSLTARISVRLSENTVKASASHFNVKIGGIYSVAGNITEGSALQVVSAVANTFIGKELNKLGELGMDLPQVRYAKYVNPVLYLRKDAIVIGTDVRVVASVPARRRVVPSVPARRVPLRRTVRSGPHRRTVGTPVRRPVWGGGLSD